MISYDFAILVGIFTAIAAVVDLRLHRIPNWITVPAALLGLAYQSLMPNGIGVGMSLAGFAIGFGLLLLPWLLGGGGMGDVKLLAALGTWLGPIMMLATFAGAAILAAMIALGVMAYNTLCEGITSTKRKYLAAGNTGGTTGVNPRPRRRVLPFAVPVALSTWLVISWLLFKVTAGA